MIKILKIERKNFALEYVKTVDLEKYRGIVSVSGDGLIFEIINGLMSREDWQKAIKTPIGQLPAGSANGFACSIAYLTNEEYKNISLEEFASTMTFYMTRSMSAPLDLINIQLSNGKLYHGFLNVEWAIVSDVDFESEKFRFLGSLRFLVGGLKRIISKRISSLISFNKIFYTGY